MILSHKQAEHIAAAAWNGGHPIDVDVRPIAATDGVVVVRIGSERTTTTVAPDGTVTVRP